MADASSRYVSAQLGVDLAPPNCLFYIVPLPVVRHVSVNSE